MVDESDPVIVVHKQGWHEGLVGLIAGRLMHEYRRPVFAIGVRDGGAKGSCRAPHGVNVVKLMEQCGEHLIRFGGHKAAGGFSLVEGKIDSFRDALHQATADLEISEPELTIDAEVDPSTINPSWLQMLERLGPFGQGNRQPMFGSRGLICTSIESLGKEGKHTQIQAVSVNDVLERPCRFVAWRKAPSELGIVSGRKFDVAYRAELTRWRGRDESQLTVEAVRDEYGETR